MAKAKVLGIHHREGVSKKTQKAYKADILHVEYLDEPRTQGFTGHEVGEVWCDCASNVCPIIPKVGDVVDVYYNRSGFVDEVTICK